MYTIMSFVNAVEAYELATLGDIGWTEDNYWGLCDYGDMDTEGTFETKEEAYEEWFCHYSGSEFWYENGDIYVKMYSLFDDEDEEIEQSCGTLTGDEIRELGGIDEDDEDEEA